VEPAFQILAACSRRRPDQPECHWEVAVCHGDGIEQHFNALPNSQGAYIQQLHPSMAQGRGFLIPEELQVNAIGDDVNPLRCGSPVLDELPRHLADGNDLIG
jgi:hypothetical protein